jgi:hypothetical protein
MWGSRDNPIDTDDLDVVTVSSGPCEEEPDYRAFRGERTFTCSICQEAFPLHKPEEDNSSLWYPPEDLDLICPCQRFRDPGAERYEGGLVGQCTQCTLEHWRNDAYATCPLCRAQFLPDTLGEYGSIVFNFGSMRTKAQAEGVLARDVRRLAAAEEEMQELIEGAIRAWREDNPDISVHLARLQEIWRNLHPLYVRVVETLRSVEAAV